MYRHTVFFAWENFRHCMKTWENILIHTYKTFYRAGEKEQWQKDNERHGNAEVLHLELRIIAKCNIKLQGRGLGPKTEWFSNHEPWRGDKIAGLKKESREDEDHIYHMLPSWDTGVHVLAWKAQASETPTAALTKIRKVGREVQKAKRDGHEHPSVEWGMTGYGLTLKRTGMNRNVKALGNSGGSCSCRWIKIICRLERRVPGIVKPLFLELEGQVACFFLNSYSWVVPGTKAQEGEDVR